MDRRVRLVEVVAVLVASRGVTALTTPDLPQATGTRRADAVGRRDVVRHLIALAPPAFLFPGPTVALEREFSNDNVLFREDFFFKFGRKPKPLDVDTPLPGAPPFVRVQTRYDAMAKYSAKILIGLDAFRALAATTATADADVASRVADDAAVVLKTLRPMGLLANSLLASESVTNEVLLARFYVNEVYLRMTDLGDVWRRSPADGVAAVEAARRNLNSFLILVNRAIPPKVGDAFEIV